MAEVEDLRGVKLDIGRGTGVAARTGAEERLKSFENVPERLRGRLAGASVAADVAIGAASVDKDKVGADVRRGGSTVILVLSSGVPFRTPSSDTSVLSIEMSGLEVMVLSSNECATLLTTVLTETEIDDAREAAGSEVEMKEGEAKVGVEGEEGFDVRTVEALLLGFPASLCACRGETGDTVIVGKGGRDVRAAVRAGIHSIDGVCGRRGASF